MKQRYGFSLWHRGPYRDGGVSLKRPFGQLVSKDWRRGRDLPMNSSRRLGYGNVRSQGQRNLNVFWYTSVGQFVLPHIYLYPNQSRIY